MEHAHPLPDGADIVTRPPSWPSHSKTTTASIATCTPPRLDEPLNQQTRLLQLRNASFRGALLPGRRISPIFSPPPNVTDAFLWPLNDENSPKASERRLLYGEDLPLNPVNILQEIHNTARQRRASPKPGFGAIFPDNTATGKANKEIGSPRAEEQDTNWSPPIPKFLPKKTSKLNHGTENDPATSPPSSPSCSRLIQGRRTSRVNPRSTSLEATKYIEHLESQLAAANAKIESYASPAANKARSSKVRALSIESRILRQEVFDWEKNFAERVKDELDQHLALEAGIRSRLQMLEDELEIKDVKMRELEWELDTMRARVKGAEGLLEVNLNLEKRIDVLTSLLVISPTKLDLGSVPSSPCKMKGHRSRSILLKGPLSPGGIRLSLNTGVEGLYSDPKRADSNSNISYSPAEMSQSIKEDERENLPEENTETSSSSRASASSDSIPEFSSRPTSIQSVSSVGLTSPEGLPGFVESQTTSAIRQRKMRRFPSGTCTLKPLILPKATVIPSIPASAPLYTFSESPFDDLSDKSVDPLTAYLSQSELSSSLSTPDMALRRRRATWTQNQTLKALEGKLKQVDGSLEASVMYDYRPTSEKTSHVPEKTSSEKQRTKRPRPLSLEKELELANGNSPNQFDDGLIPVESEAPLEADPGSHEYGPHSPSAFLRSQRNWTADSEITPKQNTRNICMEFLHHPSAPNPTPVNTHVPPKSAFDILTNLAGLISRAKQDPVVLAQRVLFNAWIFGSARFGGLGWWLLGLGFRSSQRQVRSCADNETAEETPSIRFNWQQFSAHASRQRAADSYIRNHQMEWGQYADAPHALTPGQEWQTSGPEFGLSRQNATADSEEHPQEFPCNDCEESTSRRTFRLWIHLSLAIVMAVGVAIKEGPGVLFMNTGIPAHPNQPDDDDNDNNEQASY